MIVRLLSVASGAIVLAAVVVLGVIAFRAADLRRRASLKTLLVVFFVGCAPALILSALWWRDALRVMIELHGIAFRSEGGATLRKDVRERTPGSGRVMIGDIPARARPIPQTLFGTLVFRDGALSIELPQPALRGGVIATPAHGLLGAELLEDGDRLCIRTECWTYGDGTFTSGKFAERIPPRQAKLPGLDVGIPLPFASPITAGTRTYSIDYLARHGSAAPPEETLRSFVAYARPGPALRLMVLDEHVTLRKAKPATTPMRYEIADNTRIHFYTVPTADETFETRGLVERRSVIHRAGRRGFALDFDTPEVHSLSARELAALEVLAEDKQRAVALAMGDAQLVDRSLYFSGASESVALQSSALVELPRLFPLYPGTSLRIMSPRGPADARLGAITWIGASDLAAVRLDVVRPPFLLLLAALALQLLKVFAASSMRFTYAQALFAGALEILAGVRLLFGHRVWTMPPHNLEAAELGVLAWMALPWIFLAASLPSLNWRKYPLTLAGLLFSTVFCAVLVEGPKKFVWIACHLIALVIWSAAAKAAALTQRVPRLSSPHAMYLLAAAGFMLFRIVLLLFGFKESAMFPGGRISLSAIYIPAAVILQGFFLWHLWQRSTAAGKLQRNDMLAALGFLAMLWFVPAVLTSDIGLALLNIPVFLALLYVIDRRNHVTRALILATLLVVAGGPVLRVFLPFVGSEEMLLSLASESNYARFFHFAAPEQLQQLATKRGESLAITSAILQRYIDTGLFGVGYGHTDVSPHLGDTALRDFAPAVFIAAEWGFAGTLAMLLLYALFGYVGWRMTPWARAHSGVFGERRTSTPVPIVGAVAALTIAIASVYMILANHELVLLTGKNAYLFGLDSAGDVLEMLALLLILAYCFAPQRDETAGGLL